MRKESLHIKYRITHMLCPTLYAAITNELNSFVFKKMRIAAYQVLFFSNKVEGFDTSRSLRGFYNYSHPPSHVKHMNKLEDLKVL